MKLGSFSVNNPVLVNILMGALLLMGTAVLSNMPREQFSDVSFYFASVSVIWPGVSAEDIERQITIPIEDEMQGLEDLNEINSFSSEGSAFIGVQFNDGITPERFDTLFSDVNNRFSKIDLPSGVLNTSVDSFSSNDFLPVIEIVFSGETDYSELVDLAEKMESPLKKIREVSDITFVGKRDLQVIIETDRAALESKNISLNDVVKAIQSQNTTIPAGSLATEIREYLVQTTGEAKRIEEFGGTVIRKKGTVRVGDVARIKEEYKKDGTRLRFNGESAVMLRVSKVPSGSSIEIIENVKELVDTWKSRISPDITVTYLSDSSIPIQSTIDVLMNNALFGIIFLMLILYLFIGLRNALMAAMGIPLTFAAAFILLTLMGQTFNSNTLFGLVLVLGLIVDHAIVITENCFRLRGEGLSLRDAAIQGTNQVAVPIIAATATTVAAFLPLMILPGVLGKFLKVIPLTVSIALLASTFEALFFLPSHYADWPISKKPPKKRHLFIAFQTLYGRFINHVLMHRKAVLIFAGILFVGSIALVPLIKQDLFSGEENSYFNIDIVMPKGTPINRTDEVVSRYEAIILPMVGDGDISSVSAAIGFSAGGSGNSSGPEVAQITVDLNEAKNRKEKSTQVIMDKIASFTSDIPGPDQIDFLKSVGGPPTDKPITFRLFGDNYEELLAVSERIQEEVSTEADAFNVQDNYQPGSPLLAVDVDEERAAAYGLTVSSIGQYIKASVEGITTTKFFKDNNSLDVLVRFSDAENVDPSRLKQLRIPSPLGGRTIPFTAVASLKIEPSVSSIRRLDGRREITITADTRNKDIIPIVNARVQDVWKNELEARYSGVVFSTGGQFAEFANLLGDLLPLFLIGIFLTYLILGTQFKSYTQPFLILASVPMALSGVFIYLAVSRTPLSLTVLYSAVALVGIAVNDAIVLISFINELRTKGTEVEEAVLQATKIRLRPIILTSLTTIAGLAPTAIGLGGRSVVWGPMASTIIVGLLFSTLGTLVIIPAFYRMLFSKPLKEAHS